MIFKSLRPLSRLLPLVFPVFLIAMYVWSSVHSTSATASTRAHVGTVEMLQGKGWSVSSGGAKNNMQMGDIVVMNEIVATGYKSGMSMRFIDDTTLKLGADAQLTIDEMVYDPQNSNNDSVVLRLGPGAYYFVSGKVAKQKVTIITPTTTVGIRGTELLINVDKDGSTSVGVAKGRAFMRSRENNSRTEISRGETARSDDKANVSDSHKGLDLTGDDDVDRNVEGVSDWMGDDDDKKDGDYTDFSDEHSEDEDEDDEDKEDDERDDDEKDDEGEDDDRDGEDEDRDDEDDGESDDGDEFDDGDSDDGDHGDDDDGGDDGDGGDSDSDSGDSDGGDSDSDGGHDRDSSRDGKDHD